MAESTTRSETESEEESDGEPNGVTGGEEESQGGVGQVEHNGAGQRTDGWSPRQTTGREHDGEGQISKHLNLEGHSLVLL